jgi:hypothetical protein
MNPLLEDLEGEEGRVRQLAEVCVKAALVLPGAHPLEVCREVMNAVKDVSPELRAQLMLGVHEELYRTRGRHGFKITDPADPMELKGPTA